MLQTLLPRSASLLAPGSPGGGGEQHGSSARAEGARFWGLERALPRGFSGGMREPSASPRLPGSAGTGAGLVRAAVRPQSVQFGSLAIGDGIAVLVFFLSCS